MENKATKLHGAKHNEKIEESIRPQRVADHWNEQKKRYIYIQNEQRAKGRTTSPANLAVEQKQKQQKKNEEKSGDSGDTVSSAYTQLDMVKLAHKIAWECRQL